MPISDIAKNVLQYVKDNGGKLSGGNVKDGLSVSNSEFKKAKTELRNYGLIEVGRGRGGTITIVEGVPVPEDAPKMTRAEAAAAAREERASKKRVQQKYDKIKEFGLEKAKADFPNSIIEIDSISFGDRIIWMDIWDKGKTRADVVGYYYDDE